MVPVVKPLKGGKKLTLHEQLESGGLASLASMEGSWNDWVDEGSRVDDFEEARPWLGVLIASAVTGSAWFLHRLPIVPFTIEGAALRHPIGISVLAILLGMIVANFMSVDPMRAGCKSITVCCIPLAVILLGAGMDFRALSDIGWGLFALVVGLMLLAICVAYVVGKSLGMSSKSSYLLGVGTAVCGSSAVLATSPAIDADDEDVVVTLGVVNLVGLLAMFSCVSALWVMPLDAKMFGAWAGMTIHAVPQVIAAGENHSFDAGVMATVVKLTRVTLLAPVIVLTALFISVRNGKNRSSRKNVQSLGRYVPWFIWWFIVLAVLRTFGYLPILEFTLQNGGVTRLSLGDFLPTTAKWLLAISMAAIGLQVQLKPMLKSGTKAILAGVITWLIMSCIALLGIRWIY